MFYASGPRILLVLLLGILLVGPAPLAAKVGASQTPPFDCATVAESDHPCRLSHGYGAAADRTS